MNESHAPPDESDLHAYVDDRLDAAERARVEAWLARHPARAEELRAWRNDARQLRAAFGIVPEATELTRLDPAAIRRRRQRRRRARAALAAALVLAFGLGMLGGWQVRQLQTRESPPMADAVQAYRMFALHRTVAFDRVQKHPGELQAWLAARFPQSQPLPSLTSAGFHPTAGRLLATASGPAALVLYEDAHGDAVIFYLRQPSAAHGLLPRGQRNEGQLATAYWSGKGYNYALVGRARGPDLGVIRDAAQTPLL